VVQHATQARRLAVAIALVVAGCGGGDDPKPTETAAAAPRVIHKDLGVDVRLADCRDWNRGDEAARRGTITEIATALPAGATLTEDQAYSLFEGWCSQEVARAFKLYKLYTRAAAFTPQR
jgi:hypothetical protein